MKKASMFVFFCLLISSFAYAQTDKTLLKTWELFGRVKFEPKFEPKLQMELSYPNFNPEIKALEGKIIELQGYIIPLETGTDYIVLSRYPYSQCFFCGGAGPESVSAVYFKNKPKNLKLDRYITVRGRLELNDKDIDLFNFLIKDAEIVEIDK